jgi:DNA polymerase-3 subunit epsilon
MQFVALDVETANPDLASICQVGIVSFEGGAVAATWQRLINPEDFFDEWNVSIHGIAEGDVRGAPTLPQLFADLQGLIENKIVVCHTSFDRVALGRAFEKYGLPRIDCTWLDSARVVRRAWPQFASKGYGLANISDALGIVFRHHEAKEDARAAGEVVLRAITDTGKTIDEWLIQVERPISDQQIARQGNPGGSLFGEVVVFTGALSIPRREASKMAADAGCTVSENVINSITLLVVGDQDIRSLAGQEKSSKHRKIEELITNGHSIRILGESDFIRLIGLEGAT